MSIIERDLTYFILPPSSTPLIIGSEITSFSLVSGPKSHFQGFEWTLQFPFPLAYRIILTGPDRPRPPHDNVAAPSQLCRFKLRSLDTEKCHAVFSFPSSLDGQGIVELRLWWSYQLFSEVWHHSYSSGDDATRLVMRDLQARSYSLTEHGVIRHWALDRSRLHLGLGEKAAPIDLTGRSFVMHATDAALYDAYRTDPLYKHTPFLISTPRPAPSGDGGDSTQRLTYAIYHATNSVATWDIGAEIDYPSGGWSKRFVQHWGGLEEWVLIGKGVESVVKLFAEMAGKPRLVGRDWLGYLASTMLLADKKNAQELLEEWPILCAQNDVPCSAMHLSSGFTVDEKTGSRWVFHMNKKRYPDFKAMVKIFHKAGMKVVPNVKPYMLQTHPDYELVEQGDGLFYDPISKGPSKQNIWSSGIAESGDGSWVDFSAPEARKWWARGVQGLIDLSVDGIWDDNSEFFTRDDGLLCKNEFDHTREVTVHGKINTGLMGRIMGNEMMNKVSHDTLQVAAPGRRTYVLTRSGNPAAFKYACSTWSGDNMTSWHNLRGSQHMQLNSAMSLMQSTGADVGGFGGDAPSPELFVRWVQLGVTHSRFCIHSAPTDTHGKEKLNVPWMHPASLSIIRGHIKWRYRILPFLNNLMWRSHLDAAPPNAPLFYGPFANDPALFTEKVLEGFDAWLGVGKILTAPQLFQGCLTRNVYFPKASPDDGSLYFDLHAPFGTHKAGQWVTVATPIEHAGLFAREGTVIPVGKNKVTVTALSGPARRYTDGVDVVLDTDGGQVGLDDWRGILIFPGYDGKTYTDEWIEDDGISSHPGTYTVKVSYCGRLDAVEIKASVEENGFQPLWRGILHVILPAGDRRRVVGTDTAMEGENVLLLAQSLSP
ncbi:putative glicosidase [Lasiosphaeria miniovina]|uniref:alpha-glucosidase n=1 Tax=Lasiosphaeria miniovina TaxID=1954250 RepID=A0AA40AK94_9PEZI|nr:putative glicosidase [Lasiosphaeria miniovina]KAK0717421.1 putative glicosidase [Lasiosphaeria miniovina]